MERNEVYRIIDGERSYQQEQGKPDERPLQEWIMSIRYYLHQAGMTDLYGIQSDALEQLRKAVAVGVATLEQYGCQPREGYILTKEATDAQPQTDL